VLGLDGRCNCLGTKALSATGKSGLDSTSFPSVQASQTPSDAEKLLAGRDGGGGDANAADAIICTESRSRFNSLFRHGLFE